MFRTIVNVLNISLYSATCLYAMPLHEVVSLPALYCTVLYCTVLYCTVLYCTCHYAVPLLEVVSLPALVGGGAAGGARHKVVLSTPALGLKNITEFVKSP